MNRAIARKQDFCSLFLAVVVFAVVAGGLQPVNAQPGESESWLFIWDPPTPGSTPQHYVVQVRVDGDAIQTQVTSNDTPAVTFEVFFGRDYEVRVAGVDAQGRQGPYSDWSARITAELAVPTR